MYYFKLVQIKRLKSEIAKSFTQMSMPERIAKREGCRAGVVVSKSIRDYLEHMTEQCTVSDWERSKVLEHLTMYYTILGNGVKVNTYPIAVYATNGSTNIEKIQCSMMYESPSELHFTLIGMLDVKTFFDTGKIILTDDQEPAEIDDTLHVEPDDFDIEGYLKEHKIEVK